MSTMQECLEQVGYKPTGLRARLLNNAKQKKETLRPVASLEALVDGVIDPITKPRKVYVQRAGSHYKARYEGEASCCLGETPQEASRRLKGLPRSASEKLKFLGGLL